MLKKNDKIFFRLHNEKSNTETRLNSWFRDLFIFGSNIPELFENKESKFHIVIVLPTNFLSAAAISSGLTLSYFKKFYKVDDSEKEIKYPYNQDGSTLDELKNKNNNGKFYVYRESNNKNPIFVKFNGMETLNFMDAAKTFQLNKYNFKRGIVNLYHFQNRDDLKKIEPIQEESVELLISKIPEEFEGFELKKGGQLKKKSSLEKFFINGKMRKNFDKKLEKNLINIFGNKDKILDDLSIPLDIINSKDFKVSGKLNDIVRANNIRQYQNQHSNVFSTRVNYDDNPDSEITIFEGSDAYLKMITEHYSQNTLAILSPDDVHFNDAINIANSNYQRNMIDLNNENFLNFSNKYPCMAYWRKK